MTFRAASMVGPRSSSPSSLVLSWPRAISIVAGATTLGVAITVAPFNKILIVQMLVIFAGVVISLKSLEDGLLWYLCLTTAWYLAKRLMFLESTVTPTEWFIATAMPMALLLLLSSRALLRQTSPRTFSVSDCVVFAFLAWSILRIAWSQAPPVDAAVGFGKTGIYAMAYFVGRELAARDYHVIFRFARRIVAMALVVGAYGVWQAVMGLAQFERDWIASGLSVLVAGDSSIVNTSLTLAGTSILRPFSTFSGPFYFADYLAIALLFHIAIWSRQRNIANLAVLAFLGSVLTLTLVRSSWALFFLATTLYILVASRRGGRIRSGLMGGAGIMIAVLFSATVGSTPQTNGLASLSSSTFFSRTAEWAMLGSTLSPIDVIGRGYGLRDVGTFFGGLEGPFPIGHSLVAEVMFELGAIGVCLIFALAFAALLRGRRQFLQRPGADGKTIAAVSVIPLAIVLARTFGGGFWGAEIPDELFVWLCAGLLAGLPLPVGIGSNSESDGARLGEPIVRSTTASHALGGRTARPSN